MPSASTALRSASGSRSASRSAERISSRLSGARLPCMAMRSRTTRSAWPTAARRPAGSARGRATVMRTSYWASSARRCSSFLPRRVRRSKRDGNLDAAGDGGGLSQKTDPCLAGERDHAGSVMPRSAGRSSRRCSSRSRFGSTSDGRLHEQVLRLLVQGERDHLADVRLVGQQHHDAVDAGRGAAVRRRAVPEGVEHAAEARLDLLAAVARDLERLVHDSGRWFRMAPLDSSTPLHTTSYW